MAVSTSVILDALSKVNGNSPMLKGVTLNALNALFQNDDPTSRKITSLIMESLNHIAGGILTEGRVPTQIDRPAPRPVSRPAAPPQSRYQPNMNKINSLFNESEFEETMNESSTPEILYSKDNPEPGMPKNSTEKAIQDDLMSRLDSLLY